MTCLMTCLMTYLGLGCGDNDPGAAGPNPSSQVQLALTSADGVVVTFAAWQVFAANQKVVAAGVINALDVHASLSLVLGIPAGPGQVLKMTASTTRGLICDGTSPPFDVVPGQTASVRLLVTCAAPSPTRGQPVIMQSPANAVNCPQLTSWLVAPRATPVPTTADVAVSAQGAADDVLSYTWTATGGTFTDPAVPITQFHCPAAGLQTLSVAITNGRATPCTVTVRLPPVTCS